MLRISSRVLATAFAITMLAFAPAAMGANDHASPAGPGDGTAPAVANPSTVSPALTVRTVTIIESQSVSPLHDMDAEWLAVATAMGHTASIAGQSTLDDIANLGGTDILIVSSGVIDLPPSRVATIRALLMNHGQVYLQGEYLCGYATNLGFASLVAGLGGSFASTVTLSGMLEPMAVLGILGTTPNAVPELPGYWYGCAGAGDGTITPFLQYGEHNLGFIFNPPSSDHGHIIYTTDQDWVRDADIRPTTVDLMENILTFLTEAGGVAVEGARWGDLKALYR